MTVNQRHDQSLSVQLSFEGYWHCGGGMTRGASKDASVVRDSSGLPYMPGRTLKGVLRDAARDASLSEMVTQGEVGALFGVASAGEAFGSVQGGLTFSNAELPAEWGPWARSIAAGGGWIGSLAPLFTTLQATAIDERGAASEASLRAMEVVVPMDLNASIEPRHDGSGAALPANWKAVLRRVLPFVTHLGLGRRRGLGRVRLVEVGASCP